MVRCLIGNTVPVKGPPIKTLANARDFLLKLPKSRHGEDTVQAAIEAVLADGDGPIFHSNAIHERLKSFDQNLPPCKRERYPPALILPIASSQPKNRKNRKNSPMMEYLALTYKAKGPSLNSS
jgi:hypothetical protein